MNEKKSRLEVNIKNFFLDLHFPERPQKLNQTPNILRDDNKIWQYVSKIDPKKDISYTKFVPSLKPIYKSKILITVRPRTKQLVRQCALEIYHTNWIFFELCKKRTKWNSLYDRSKHCISTHIRSGLEIERKSGETPIFYFFFQTFTSLCPPRYVLSDFFKVPHYMSGIFYCSNVHLCTLPGHCTLLFTFMIYMFYSMISFFFRVEPSLKKINVGNYMVHFFAVS